jgi:hypothetical protein
VDIIKIEHFLRVYGVQNCSANGPGAHNKKTKQGVGRLRRRIASSLHTFPGISTTWIGATRIVDCVSEVDIVVAVRECPAVAGLRNSYMGSWYLDENDNWEPSFVLDFLRVPEISILEVDPDQEDN